MAARTAACRAAGRHELAIIVTCGLAYFIDQAGVALGGAFPALFSQTDGAFHSDWVPVLVSSPFAGAAVGVPFLGIVARHRGTRGSVLARDRCRRLEQEGRLADTRVASDQDRRARNKAAAADPIEIGNAGLMPARQHALP